MTNQADKPTTLYFDSLVIGYETVKGPSAILPPLTSRASSGELVAVAGLNGIGKSTLLRTLAGLLKPLGGTVTINGKKMADYSRYELAGTIGYVSTEPVRVTGMNVYDLVALGRYPYTGWSGRLTADDHLCVSEAIGKTGLQELVGRYINELSDGERQRAMIARSLAQDADLLVMDELTAFLDIRSKYEIVHLLHDLSRNRGKTIIFSTHDILTALGEADKIWILLEDGIVEGAPEDLVLKGSFNRLFESSVVKFSEHDASFTFSREYRGRAAIEADGLHRYWTGRAAARAGYEISRDRPDITIRVVNDENRTRWHLLRGSSVYEFESVYNLITFLNSAN